MDETMRNSRPDIKGMAMSKPRKKPSTDNFPDPVPMLPPPPSAGRKESRVEIRCWVTQTELEKLYEMFGRDYVSIVQEQ